MRESAMSTAVDHMPKQAVSLDDKWTIDCGRVVMNGTQAIARVLLAQKTIDEKKGWSTAGYITGYRGSPLGNVDATLWTISERLSQAHIIFQPGLNEDIAATAVHGTQQIEAIPDARYDGVFAAWYGKGPGVDRSGDAFKHGNYAGTHPKGGVLIFYGDDHAGKSSTVAHHSEQAVAASLIPSLYPSNAQELLEFGLLGFAMSRYSGSWVAIKCVNEVAEQTATVEIDIDSFEPIFPPLPTNIADVHIAQRAFNPLRDEQTVVERRLPLVHAFIRANGIDRTVIRAQKTKLGIVTAGKSYGDVRAALDLLGLNEATAAECGISLYKVGCIWPLESQGIARFGRDQATLLVVEEKQSFLEQQIAATLINLAKRPLVIGKLDEEGGPLLSATAPLQAFEIARVIADRLDRLGSLSEAARERVSIWRTASPADTSDVLRRSPYFCSGCPHSRSTRVPEDSLSMTGIGCHTMANFVRPKEALLPTQMGGEGGNWLGLSPFTNTRHIFQNMGDGTYYHSGLLAIRAAIAAGANITYKILYNDAVAMTGGQPVDGPISVAMIAQQVAHEGVAAIILVSDNPDAHRGNPQFPPQMRIEHRDRLDLIQRELRDIPGCTILIYEQTCAAEKRRRRKRGLYPDPPKRLFISTEVCEGCGDCSAQSTCVSLMPVETELGTKRRIDQSSCNKDYSCVDGFCPSFVTIYGAEPRKPTVLSLDENLFASLPEAPRAPIKQSSYNLMVAGIGGTGVVTVGALIGMAAHLEGLSMSLFDMTGLSQKNGAVYSHVRIGRKPEDITTQRLCAGEADLLMAFDVVAALAPESSATLQVGRTRAVANAAVTPTAAFQFDRDLTADPAFLLAKLRKAVGEGGSLVADASALALAILGDTIGANLFLVGVAAQKGMLPVGTAAIEKAVVLNGVAVRFNLKALHLGRLFVIDPERVLALLPSSAGPIEKFRTLDEVVEHRTAHLRAYQGEALVERYRAMIENVRQREVTVVPNADTIALAVASSYAKLLTYKDEYEVARLLTSKTLHDEIAKNFEPGAKIAFNMAPPILARKGSNERLGKREFGAWIRPLLHLLARMRVLRGTQFDPFGYTEERRTERTIISEYESLITRILPALTPENHASASRLLAEAQKIRGFGPVKDESVRSYRETIGNLEREFFAKNSAKKKHHSL